MILITIITAFIATTAFIGGVSLSAISTGVFIGWPAACVLWLLVRGRRDTREFRQQWREAERASYTKPRMCLEYDPGGCSGGGDCEPVNAQTLANRAAYQQETVAQRWSRYAETQTGRQTNETAKAAEPDKPIPARNWPVQIPDWHKGIPLPEEQPQHVPLWRR